MTLIEQADVWLFRLMNQSMVHPAADGFMVFLTMFSMSWYILLCAALFIIVRRGTSAIPVIVMALLAVGMADCAASGILKPLVQRIRPCFALDHVRLLINQSRSYSFASSHAANTAAVATTTWLFFHRGALVEKLFTVMMALYAVMVSWSRVYVGVHYPSDIFAGMIIGIASAMLLYLLYSWIWKNVVQPRLKQRECCPKIQADEKITQ